MIARNTTRQHGATRRASRGFSLIELLIVVAIILIIAAIAIPNLLRAKISANEASAVSSIHSINTAEIAYSSANPLIGFSVALADLGPAAGGYIDATLASGSKSGYNFTYVQTAGAPSNGYTFNADPQQRGVTGQRSFYSDQNNVTHFDPSNPATAASLILQ
ncbi:MAG: prepilin-type N-terminal cleavage/methylation domain-containing protein [Candidatus Acidiferrum sp.]|jgi:prepilin-type N-terminal cleavage/methylation domain-containing protein